MVVVSIVYSLAFICLLSCASRAWWFTNEIIARKGKRVGIKDQCSRLSWVLSLVVHLSSAAHISRNPNHTHHSYS